MLIECPHCYKNVLVLENNMCPNCSNDVNDLCAVDTTKSQLLMCQNAKLPQICYSCSNKSDYTLTIKHYLHQKDYKGESNAILFFLLGYIVFFIYLIIKLIGIGKNCIKITLPVCSLCDNFGHPEIEGVEENSYSLSFIVNKSFKEEYKKLNS